jgi:hypothetical protein
MDQSGAEKRAKVEEEAPVAAEAPSEQNVLVDNYHTFSVPVKPEYLIIRTKEISVRARRLFKIPDFFPLFEPYPQRYPNISQQLAALDLKAYFICVSH